MTMTSEEFIEHALRAPYDPQKAHAYYLRVRKLKGRKKGDVNFPNPKFPKVGQHLDKRAKTSEQLRNEAHARVVAIQARLDRLKEVLAKLVEEAKGRSGVEDKPATKKTEAKADTSSTTKDKPKTSQQKKEDAKKARDRYEKEKKQSPDQQIETLRAQVKDVEEQIRKIREQLKESVNKARSRMNTGETSKTVS